MAARRYSEKVQYQGDDFAFDFRTAGDRARFRDLWKAMQKTDTAQELQEKLVQAGRMIKRQSAEIRRLNRQ
jgi:hypothetical protein